MGDPTAIVPYHDPFEDINTIEQILMSDENPNLFQQPVSCDPSSPQSRDYEEIVDANDPFVDPFFQDLFNHEAGPSRIEEETIGFGQERDQQYGNDTQSWNMGNPIQLSVWPLPAVPYTCTCCQVLREITHTNGVEITKLEIHGRLGMICHAILDKYSGEINQTHEYHMFDFCKESVRSVKQFLVQYCEERKQNGYVIMFQDPLLDFYEALCVGLDCNLNYSNLETDNFVPGDECQMSQQAEAMAQPETDNDAVRLTRSALAVQRERTSKLKLKDFVEYLHLPITQAAKKMDICLTVLKKICRKHGLSRWPYRKIKSIRRKISKARESLNAADDAQERMRAEAEIQRLQEKLANIFAVFSDPS